MRPLIQIVQTELEGVTLFALHLFDERGQFADQIIRDIVDPLTMLDTVLDVTIAHRIETVDIETDDESVFAKFIAMPGFNCKLVGSVDLAIMYDALTPANPIFPVIQELYLNNKRGNEECLIGNSKQSLTNRTASLTGFARNIRAKCKKLASVCRIFGQN